MFFVEYFLWNVECEMRNEECNSRVSACYRRDASNRLAACHIPRISFLIICFVLLPFLSACDYDETVELCDVTVQLVYPEDSVDPYPGVRVELKDAYSSVFVSSTDAMGVAHFRVTPGIYEASSATQLTDDSGETWWRYNFNGVRSMIIISPDSLNQIRMDLKMSKKRIVH
jgi:hypothetical protein